MRDDAGTGLILGIESSCDETAAAVVRRTTVGRESQRAQLQRVFARVKQGRSLIVALTGEPGIGKTSLVEDFLEELVARGERPTIARGRCSESLAGLSRVVTC